jgi:hypothetical protein
LDVQCGLGNTSPSPANQLSFANRNNQSVNPLVLQRLIEHGPQYRLMIDRVVCATRMPPGIMPGTSAS